MPRAALSLPALLIIAAGAHAESIVIENVRVLTMTEAGTLERANVLVEGERIIGVGGPDLVVPGGARRIDGRGRTLMPGLADMHVHYFSDDDGPVFLANGITTVRNLWGSEQTLVMDAMAGAGVRLGPHIATSGPLMDGPEPIWGEASMMIRTPEEAVGAIESQRTTGYKAVKLYEGLTPEIYRAAVAAAKAREMQVWTHTPMGMGVEEVIDLEVDSIEHFNDVEEALLPDGVKATSYFATWAAADPAKMAALARRSAEAGVWHSPTFAVIAKRYQYGADPEAFYANPDAAYVGPGLTGWWAGSAQRMGPYTDEKRAAAAQQRAFLKALHDAGAPLLIGTDTPNPFVLPGFAIHDELAAFVAAGIPVAEVLRIATADAAKFLREEGQWGVVAEGARADLVLLETDPRDDLATLRRPLGVMMNGRWHDRDMLDAELAALRARVAAARAAAVAEPAAEDE